MFININTLSMIYSCTLHACGDGQYRSYDFWRGRCRHWWNKVAARRDRGGDFNRRYRCSGFSRQGRSQVIFWPWWSRNFNWYRWSKKIIWQRDKPYKLKLFKIVLQTSEYLVINWSWFVIYTWAVLTMTNKTVKFEGFFCVFLWFFFVFFFCTKVSPTITGDAVLLV